MTPAVNYLKKKKIRFRIHTYDHIPESQAYGKEAAEKLDVSFDRLFKTLVVEMDQKELCVALVPVSKQLNLKALAKAGGSKKAKMAEKNRVERMTGYIAGGVSPFGQKKKLATIVDRSALGFNTVYVSGGRRGLQIELAPDDLVSGTNARIYDISR